MTRIVSFVLIALALAAVAPRTAPPLAAQTRAKATNVPVIPHEAVPNFFKNPPGIYTGENMGIATNSKGNIYIYHRANETRLFEYSPAGAVHPRDRPEQLRLRVRALGARRRPGQHLGGRRRHRHARQVQPRGPGADGHRPARGSGRDAGQHARQRHLPRPQREVPLRPADRRRLRPAGQHLRVRRLLRRAGGEVRQDRPVRQGRRQARQRQPRVQHAALDRHRLPGQRLRRRPRQRARPGARQRPQLEGQLHRRRQSLGRVCVGRARAEESRQAVPRSRPTRGRTARRPPAPSSPARST